MSEKWPDNWVKLPCPNGHEIQSYQAIHDRDIHGVCDVCGVPYIYRFPDRFDSNIVPKRM